MCETSSRYKYYMKEKEPQNGVYQVIKMSQYYGMYFDLLIVPYNILTL